MPKIDDRIQTLEAKLKQLKTRQQQIEARARSVATKRSRAEELRRKILVGAVVLAKVEAKEIDEAMLKVAQAGDLATGGSGLVWFGWGGAKQRNRGRRGRESGVNKTAPWIGWGT